MTVNTAASGGPIWHNCCRKHKDVSRLGVVNTAATDRQSPLELFPEQPKPRLYDCVVEALRSRHYSCRTEQAYIHWIRRFISFHARTIHDWISKRRANCAPPLTADVRLRKQHTKPGETRMSAKSKAIVRRYFDELLSVFVLMRSTRSLHRIVRSKLLSCQPRCSGQICAGKCVPGCMRRFPIFVSPFTNSSRNVIESCQQFDDGRHASGRVARCTCYRSTTVRNGSRHISDQGRQDCSG